jgi:hypothetical protein
MVLPDSGRDERKKLRLRNRNIESTMEGMRKTLLGAAIRRETMTYGALMRRFGLSRGRVLSEAIGEADRREYASGAPGFAALIVRKDTGYPGGGYFCDDTLPLRLRRPSSRRNDPRLSGPEMEHIKNQQERIWKFYAGADRKRRE